MQELAGGASFVGWGQQPYFTEHGPDGALVRVAGALPSDNGSYRAYRFPWTARPDGPPGGGGHGDGAAVTVYASWNGATEVARWRVRGGLPSPTGSRPWRPPTVPASRPR